MLDLKKLLQRFRPRAPKNTPAANQLLEKISAQDSRAVLRALNSNSRGLNRAEVLKRLIKCGPNEIAGQKKRSPLFRLLSNFGDPLSILLLVLAGLSLATKDWRAAMMILIMVIISVGLRFFQEVKADLATEKLKKLVKTKVRVVRNGKKLEIDVKQLVPGDIIHLSAGNIIPADVRLIGDKDLFVNQATLTGESLPAEKNSQPDALTGNPLERKNLCFFGTHVESGSGTAVVVLTGPQTYLGQLALTLTEKEPPTNFDLGIKSYTWLMIRLIAIMVPTVFIINGLGKGNWLEAFLFALAVAIGLTPEMLPMIVTVNLGKGALMMSKKKVIVKRLDAIQNLGAMDILCTDKTGTLTEGRVILEKHLDILGRDSEEVLHLAYLNSYFQTGLDNLIDGAILSHEDIHKRLKIEKTYRKIDELPFDFKRRRMSVIVEKGREHLLICKGAAEEIMSLCNRVRLNDQDQDIAAMHHQHRATIEKALESEGFRIIAVAVKTLPAQKTDYTIKDERNLTLLGFLAFFDPPKATAKEAISALSQAGVAIKIMTGDNGLVAQKICQEVGLAGERRVVLGQEIEKMNKTELKQIAERENIFAKLMPAHKKLLIDALRDSGHAVGFLGDGINDAPALKAADVGISVDSASDIAKESSDIILLEKNLLVLKDGIIEGRKVFGNIVKYIEMAASSNFGNMFSVVIASLFLPFLPMLPLQILINNLLYEISQLTIPTDHVDEEYLSRPRRWDISHIRNFIFHVGPLSSIFDVLTYLMMIFVFGSLHYPALFHTGWFIESLLTQSLIIHVIRTRKIPFIQSRASWPLLLSTSGIVVVGIALTLLPVGRLLGFVTLPPLFWLMLTIIIIAYFALTQMVKNWLYRRQELY